MTQVAIYTGQEAADQERVELLKNYNPKEHLVKLNTKQGMKDYYPAGWRLYELRLRFPMITIESEIVHMNAETNFVIVKAWIYNGETYATSTLRGSGFKQGLLSELDKVETRAKARAARDCGISTELALDMDDDDAHGEVASTLAKSTVVSEEERGHTNGKKSVPTVEQLRERAKGLYELAVKKGHIEEDKTGATFLKLACDVCQVKIASIGQLTISRLDAIEKYLDAVK